MMLSRWNEEHFNRTMERIAATKPESFLKENMFSLEIVCHALQGKPLMPCLSSLKKEALAFRDGKPKTFDVADGSWETDRLIRSFGADPLWCATYSGICHSNDLLPMRFAMGLAFLCFLGALATVSRWLFLSDPIGLYALGLTLGFVLFTALLRRLVRTEKAFSRFFHFAIPMWEAMEAKAREIDAFLEEHREEAQQLHRLLYREW